MYVHSCEWDFIIKELPIEEEILSSLEEKNFLRIFPNEEVRFTSNTFEIFKRERLSENTIERRAKYLAEKLRELYPSGKKNGKWPFKSNLKDTTHKLKIFLKKYPEYSNSQIVKATKDYVDSFNQFDRDSGMHLLKYFIEKNNSSLLVDWIEDVKNFPSKKEQVRINRI
jgi:hypothetical protein